MKDLFAPNPTNNLLPYDGQLYDLGSIDLNEIADSYDDLYKILLTTLPWQSDVVTLFGKTHITKRQIVWMGDEGLSYRYSGHTRRTTHWHPTVFHMKQIVEEKIKDLKFTTINAISNNQKYSAKDDIPFFNTCLLNYYPSGSEGMGYHADDEKELGDKPLIAALSFGATRKMLFKSKQAKPEHLNINKTPDKVDLYLASGQLIVMAGVTQQHWKHSIAKTTKVSEGRISLTFRRMLTI